MNPASSQGTGAAERDHFIPARKIDVLDAVIAHGALTGEPDREKFRQLCKLLGAIYHYEYFDQLERLRNDYFYFSPETRQRPSRAPTPPLSSGPIAT